MKKGSEEISEVKRLIKIENIQWGYFKIERSNNREKKIGKEWRAERNRQIEIGSNIVSTRRRG